MPAEVVSRAYAEAAHILVRDETAAEEIRLQIEAGKISFDDAARQFSQCKSKFRGGTLGTFKSLARILYLPYEGKFSSVTAFDALVFSPTTELNVINVVTTDWGTHLVKVTAQNVRL